MMQRKKSTAIWLECSDRRQPTTTNYERDEMMMTKQQATEWVYSRDDQDDLDQDDLTAAFVALYGHEPADADERRDMWSLCCAATPNCGTRPEISDDDRVTLIAEIDAAKLACPEQVADWVLDASTTGGMQSGRDELAKAIANDANETRRLG